MGGVEIANNYMHWYTMARNQQKRYNMNISSPDGHACTKN